MYQRSLLPVLKVPCGSLAHLHALRHGPIVSLRRHDPLVKSVQLCRVAEQVDVSLASSAIKAPIQKVRPSADVDNAPVLPAANLETQAKQLFDDQHVTEVSPALLLWAIPGLFLAAFRMSLWILGVLLDADWFRNPAVVSTYLRLLGFRTTWKNVELLPPGRHVMVSNHVTPGDLMVLFQGLPQRYTHLITSAMPPRVVSTRNLPCVLRFATPDVYEELASTSGRGEEAERPIHLFPEGGLTNGRHGMMQFSRGFTRILRPKEPVVPVALRATTPLGLRTHTLLSSFPANLFWMSFCPYVEVEATILPAMTQQEGEGRGAFARRVQQAIADAAGLAISDVTIQSKRKVMQRAEASRRR